MEDNEDLCDFCTKNIEKNLNPQNPVCEGGWCDEARDMIDEDRERKIDIALFWVT